MDEEDKGAEGDDDEPMEKDDYREFLLRLYEEEEGAEGDGDEAMDDEDYYLEFLPWLVKEAFLDLDISSLTNFGWNAQLWWTIVAFES